MSYKSEGKIYLSEKAQQLLTPELKEYLNGWKKDEEVENVWGFESRCWYKDYKDVQAWENFIEELSKLSEDSENKLEINDEDWDFLILGEDGTVFNGLPSTNTKFGTYTKIYIYL